MTTMKSRLTSKLIGDEILYLDELGSEPKWILKSKFIQYIKSTYLVTPQIYFDKVMELRGITNLSKCPICGCELKWIGLFSGYSHACSPICRNKLISIGNPDLIIVTNKGLITHVVNQDFLTKFAIPSGFILNIPTECTLLELISYLTESGCLWISGLNARSIKYTGDKIQNLKLTNSIL